MSLDMNLYSRRHDYHRYSSDDFALTSLGIANYSWSSANLFFKSNPPNPDLAEFFGNVEETKNKVLGIGKESKMELMAFNPTTRKYELITGLDEIVKLDDKELYPPEKFDTISVQGIEDFLNNWDVIQLGIEMNPLRINSYRAVAYKIQNSLSGCILFNADLKVLKNDRNVKIRLALSDYKDSNSDRSVSFRGSPIITSIPETADGLQFSPRFTNEAPVGAYVPPTFGGNSNPANTVTSNLRLVYNPSTGQYESGTQQILMRLVTDLDPANIPDFNGETLTSLSRSDVYDDGEDGFGYMADFTTGSGMPLSKENGNPYLYGPNFVGGCENQPGKIVRVVNRSGNSFKNGDLVMCSYIDGEWIVMQFGGAGENDANRKKINFGRFEYQEYLMPADSFFSIRRDLYKDNPLIRMMPDNAFRNLRNEFYLDKLLDIKGDSSFESYNELTGQYENNLSIMNNISELIPLNLFASTIPSTTEDPKKYIKENFPWDNRAARAELTNNAANHYGNDIQAVSNKYRSIMPGQDSTPASLGSVIMPRNVTNKAVRNNKLTVRNVDNNREVDLTNDLLLGLEVPLFWGILFPDGYVASADINRTQDNAITVIPFLKNDPNIKEFSAKATASQIDLGNDVDNILSIGKYWYTQGPVLIFNNKGGIETNILRHTPDTFALTPFGYDRYYLPTTNALTYQVPLKPNRLQFSPMCLERLYFDSKLNNSNYASLKSSIDFIKGFFMFEPGGSYASMSLGNNFLFKDSVGVYDNPYGNFEAPFSSTNPTDIGNIYHIPGLALSDFTLDVHQRHSAPYGGIDMLPSHYGYRRCPVIPILTCKSSVRTAANSLTFDIQQVCGMSPKVTISNGYGPQIFATPLGMGMTWQESPAIPSSEQSQPQWGDGAGADDIDSFGTTSLHVRVFEGWPSFQTVYYGNWFTPLHFNPVGSIVEYEILEENGAAKAVEKIIKTKDENGEDVERYVNRPSPVDFKVPTKKDGRPFRVNEVVPSGTLAPVSEWKYNTIRRGQLVTGGGFVYYRNIVAVANLVVFTKQPTSDEDKTNYGGSNYAVGDKFRYPDGTIFKVTNTTSKGAITGVLTGITQDTLGEIGLTSDNPNIQPVYLGGNGTGAIFEPVNLWTRPVLDYDAGPKEVVPITRLTKKSDPKQMAVGANTVSVSLHDETLRKPRGYDIFYFFHNDPSHYSIDFTHPFNGGWAQYVISEVNGA